MRAENEVITMINCTFAGHKEVYLKDAELRIEAAILDLLEQDESVCFYCGGIGAFDELCSRTVKRMKILRQDKEIRLYLVIPYMMQRINKNKQELMSAYDEILFPDQLSVCHYKRAIYERNKWMIDRCQILISYVVRPFGGAWKMYQYARERELQIINLTDG